MRLSAAAGLCLAFIQPVFAGVGNLKVNHLVAPIGVEDTNPRMQWRVTGMETAAVRIAVGTDSAAVARGEGNMWVADLKGNPGSAVAYKGCSLQPATRYFWQVAVTGPDGKTEKSAVASFETGIMDTWHASWISDHHGKEYHGAPYFRRDFKVTKPVESARLYVAAGGLSVVTLNGERVGDRFLEPAYTRYDRRVTYSSYDVTGLLRRGENVAGVVLGNGWYNHQAKAVWDYDNAPWRNRPAFCLELRIKYTDGSSETVVTDLSWRTKADMGLLYNNIYTGEHYDFNLPGEGWNCPGYDVLGWGGVRLRSAPAPVVSSQQMEPIRRVSRIGAVDFRKLNDSTWIYDFGRNMAGIAEVDVKGAKGTRLKLAHGERLYPDGTLDPSNIDVYYRGDRSKEPFQTDILVLSGNRDQFVPEFSYKGFRYVQVTAAGDVELDNSSVTAREVHSDVASAGSITSSNPLLDAMVKAARNSYISNLMGYPTDCPQREKNGWTGDGHLAIETGLYNYDGITVYEKWLTDHRDEQQPNGVLPDIIPTGGWGYGTDNGLDWTSTIAIIPWNLYLFYGDDRALRDCYDNIKRYVDYVDSNSSEHLSAWGRGDWVPVSTGSDKQLMSSIYFFIDADILAKAAALFGRVADAERYSRLASDIRDAINDRFLDHEKGIYASGSQTEMSMPLMWNIVPEDMKPKIAANLADKVKEAGCHLDTGVHGAKSLLNALSENGYADVAYRVAVQDTYPSWGWWIVNGATTLLENWDLKAERDISDNHIMFGEIGAWPYKGLGGIFPDAANPGFRHIILRPNFATGPDRFEARHESPFGEIVSGWVRKGKKVTYTATVPANTTATLTVPAGFKGEKTITLTPGTHTIVFTKGK